MNKKQLALIIGVALAVAVPQTLDGRGFGGGGGGGRGGGGGFSGGGGRGGGFSGGDRSGGFSGGDRSGGGGYSGGGRGYSGSGGGYSGARPSAGDRAGGASGADRYGGAEAGAGRVGGVGAAGPVGADRVGGAGFSADRFGGAAAVGASRVGLPTDAGFDRSAIGQGAVARYTPAGNRTAAVSSSVAAARGSTVRNSFNHYDMYGHGWNTAHPGAWFAAGWGAGRIWNAATWPSLGAWWGWGGDVQPVYYDYGNNITYQGDEVYYGDQPTATADQYYQQAQNLAESAPAAATAPAEANGSDWMPLGVFSLVQGDQTDTNAVFQLAVNKEGTLAGNFTSVLTGTNLPVHGSVDKKSQRVAWTVGDNKTTVYDTGIGNLTKDQAPVLVHFDKDKTQQWMLIRLEQPEGEQNGSTTQPSQ